MTSVDRDPRERVQTIAFLAFVLQEKYEVIDGDDASQAQWFPISELPELAFGRCNFHKKMMTPGYIVSTDQQSRNNGRLGTLYTPDEEKYHEQIENRNAFRKSPKWWLGAFPSHLLITLKLCNNLDEDNVPIPPMKLQKLESLAQV